MEEHTKIWSEYYQSNKEKVTWWYDKWDSHIEEFLERNYSQIPNNRILDVGCGMWKNTLFFLQKKMQYLGIDIAPYAVQSAIKRFPKSRFLCSSILEIPAVISFWMIIDAGCIHVNPKHMIDQFLEKYHSLLSVWGKLFLRVFQSSYLTTEPIYKIDDILPVWGYTELEIVSIVERYFKIEQISLDTEFYDQDNVFYIYLSRRDDS